MGEYLLWCKECKLMKDGGQDNHCPKCGHEMKRQRAISVAVCPTCSEKEDKQSIFDATVRNCINCGRQTRVDRYPVID